MGAMVGPNVGLVNFGSIIIRKVADAADEGYASKSTEETIPKIEEYNKNRDALIGDNKNVLIGSMDVEKWYPSMIAEPSAKEIREMVEESEIDFKGFDYDVVSQYLGEYLTMEEIIKEGMEDMLYIRKEKQKKEKKERSKIAKNVSKKHVQKANKGSMKPRKNLNKNGVNNQDNTKVICGDVTLEFYDNNGPRAHKNKGELTQNNTNEDDGDEQGATTRVYG